MSRFGSFAFTLLVASLVGCSSSSESGPVDPAGDSATTDSVAADALTTEAAVDSASAEDSATVDGGACPVSVCDHFGYTCDGNKEVACARTPPSTCYYPLKSRECPADKPCNPSTGTCGGCNPSDACTTKADGSFAGCIPYTAQWCRKDVDGCVKTVNEKCGIACVGGAREGCCGGEGQMCCSPPGAACVTGLSCVGAVCAK